MTDPFLSKTAGPLGIGPNRYIPAAMKVADLPDINTILISHNHYDHLDASTLKKIKNKKNITVICLGKSTYARLGIIVNTTPAEASWEGHLTLEFSNSSGADCRIYANEGICQLLFFEGDPCDTTYSDRQGKYQHQPVRVTLARI